MSQSLLYHAFGVRAGYEYVRTDYQAGAVQFHLAVKAELFVCPACQSAHVIRKGARERSLQTVTEGLNSKIQSLKTAARGFRNFANYRTRILFFCGKLSLHPL